MTATSDTDDVCYMPAVLLAEAVRERTLSPVEIVDALLDRIDRLNPLVNAFTIVRAEEAADAAKVAERAVMKADPESLGRLHGIPFTIKDMTPTAGVRTSFGSKAFAEHVPSESGLVYERLLAEGGVFLAKTTTSEFAWVPVTDSPLTGTTNNPWKLTHTVGGSSGGAAASVAAGMGPLATGTDGGGSIRLPAGFCGVVGLKPSYGRVPIFLEDYVFETTTHSGPITRTVRDAALMLSVLAGPDERDPFSLDEAGIDYVANLEGVASAGLRIGFSPDLGLGPVDSDVREHVGGAARIFERDLDADVEEVTTALTDPLQIIDTILPPVAAIIMEDEVLPRIGRESVSTVFRQQAENAGPNVSAMDYYRAIVMARSALYQEVASLLTTNDLLLTPTTPCLPFPHTDDAGPSEIAGQAIPQRDRWRAWLFLTSPFNFTGHPAISIPCGFSSNGLPVGLQIIGRRHADVSVLRAAAAFEAVAPWIDQRPRMTPSESLPLSRAVNQRTPDKR